MRTSREGLGRSARAAARAAAFTMKLASAIVALAFSWAALSCAGVQRDLLYDAPAEVELRKLEGLELALVRLRAKPEQAAYLETRAAIEARLGQVTSDPAYRARLLALAAEASLQAGRRTEAAQRLAEAKAAYPGDELTAVVSSRLARTNQQRLEELEASLLVADGSFRIRAELGAALAELGRHREAVAAFDAALPYLPDDYRLLYGERRDRSFALRDAELRQASSSAAHLTRQPLSALGMAVLAQNETSALDTITGGIDWDPNLLFNRLKALGWYLDPAVAAAAPMSRRDAAFFLWNLMARGRRELLTRYSLRYAARSASPVADLPYGSAYFDAALGVVEENVMNLPDGRNFRPDDPVAGLDFYAWLRAAAAWR